MAREGVGGIFGKPRPPRGKVVKASERLEEDAQEMEARLCQLRLSMLEEKQRRDQERPLKHAGNRWRSAREDRGTVSRYARDVERKLKTRGDGKPKKPKKKPTDSADKPKKKKTQIQRSTVTILSPATVMQWTMAQVLEWLLAVGLEEYQSAFEFHHITGKALLALTPDGCSKLGISKLSARNRLLTSVEQIREQQNKSQQGGAAEIIDSKLRDGQPGPEVPSPVSKLAAKTHWSHVAPLAETAVVSGDGQVPVNLADGAFDEDASHASFMKALLEWRESDSATPEAADVGNQEEEWVNPMLAGHFHTDNTDHDHTDGQGGGALLNGTYDESEARESFLEALQAWRTGGTTPNLSQTATPVEQTESGCAPSERKSCWQCYRVVSVDSVVVDEQSNKPFCGASCQAAFREQYARFYTK